MKILITTIFFPPQNAIASQRPYVWAREWAKLGHDVTVLTIRKEAKDDQSQRSFQGFRVIETSAGSWIERLRSKRNSIRYHTVVKESATKRTGGFKAYVQDWLRRRGFLSSVRLPDVFDLWIPQARQVIREQLEKESFDVIVSTFGPHASLRAGYHAHRRWPKAKWIVDFRDLWTDNHVYPGFWPFTWFEKILERFYLRRVDAITTVSPALATSLQARAHGKPVVVFTNGFDPEETAQTDVAANHVRSYIRSEKKLTFVYTGSLHPVQRNPGIFLQALTRLTDEERSKVDVIFAGPREAFLDAQIESLKLGETVRALGSLKREESLRLQNEASVLLFFEYQHEAGRDGVLTGKLFEYLATGRPIWAVGVDATTTVGSLLTQNFCGQAFSRDTDRIVTEIRETLASGPAPNREIQRESDILHTFNRAVLARRMIEWIVRK